MPVPLSWGSIDLETSTTHASEASIRSCLSWIRPAWFPEIKAICSKGAHARHVGFRRLRRRCRTIPRGRDLLSGNRRCPPKQRRPYPYMLRLEIEMSRIILICSLALLTSGVSQSSNAIERANQTLWAQGAWRAPMWLSTPAAPLSVSACLIWPSPCGTRRTSVNADGGDRRASKARSSA